MDRLPQVTTILSSNNLGRAGASEDGFAALIGHGVAAGDFALGDVLTFNQLADAEAKGITAAYDSTNGVTLHRHIADFYDTAPVGATLLVMPVAKTVTVGDIVSKDGTYAPALLDAANGKIRLLGVSTSSLDTFANIVTAMATAQLLYKFAFDTFRPLSIFIEGRNCPADLTTLPNLRDAATGPNANRVHLVISQDYTVVEAAAGYANYANLGHALGRAANVPVQRNIGRVKDGALPITVGALSNGTKISELTTATLDTLNDKGYIFLRTHVGKSGFYFNGDHSACPISDDYYSLARGRTMDKAVRIVREVYVNELLDDIDINPDTGKMEPDVITSYQQACDTALLVNMLAQGNASGARTYVDPEQDVLSTDKVNTRLKIVPKGTVKQIEVELGYSKTLE